MLTLCDFATAELVEELKNRQGVTVVIAEPHRPFEVQFEDQEISTTGPAVILIVQD